MHYKELAETLLNKDILNVEELSDGTIFVNYDGVQAHGFGSTKEEAIYMFAEMISILLNRLTLAKNKDRISTFATETLVSVEKFIAEVSR